MKKILFLIILNIIFINSKALTYGGCEVSDVSRMRKILNNINISYDYTMVNDQAVFSVTINNLTNDIYFYDMVTQQNYYYWNTSDGEIKIHNYQGGTLTYKFYSNNSNCSGLYLGTKRVNFPNYNKYYSDPLCADVPNFSLCQKWIYLNYSRTEFEEMIENYKQSKLAPEEEKIRVEYDKGFIGLIIDFYIDYYYYFFGSLIVICLIIMFINDKKNKFKL